MDFLKIIETLSRIFHPYLWAYILLIILIWLIIYLLFLFFEKVSRAKELKNLLKEKEARSIIRNYCNSCNRETFWYMSIESGKIKKFYCLSCNDNLK